MKKWTVLLTLLGVSLLGWQMNDATASPPMAPFWRFGVMSLVSDGKGILYAATNAGIYRSEKGGADWKMCISGDVDSIAQHPDGTLFAVIREHVYSSLDGRRWVQVTKKDEPALLGGQLFIDSKGTLFITRSSVNGKFLHSSDGGRNWSKVLLPVPLHMLDDLVINKLVEANGTLYVDFPPSRESLLFIGRDHGKTWETDEEIGQGKGQIELWSLLVDPHGVLYADTADGRVVKKLKRSTKWVEILSAPEISMRRRLLAVDSKALYLTESPKDADSYLLRGKKNGQDWIKIMDGLPNTRGLVFSGLITTDPDTLYINTSFGIYKSTNGGTNWASASTGMPPDGSRDRPTPSKDGC